MSRANPYYFSQHWKQLKAAARRRSGGWCEVEGCRLRAVIVDHIVTRPPVPYPTARDVLANVRDLCRPHDAQVKERRRGDASSRRAGGRFTLKGCDAEGWPLDPTRRG